MGARILVKKADGSHQVDLKSEVSTIGRNDDNAVVLDDGAASRHHAQIKLEGGQYFVTDLGSLNGTFLNGVQISGPRELKDGDVITIGTTNMTLSITPEETTQTLPNVPPVQQSYQTPPVQQAYQAPLPPQQQAKPPQAGGTTPARPIVPPAGTAAKVAPATAKPAAKAKTGGNKKLIIIAAVVVVCLLLACVGGVAAAITQGLITLPQ